MTRLASLTLATLWAAFAFFAIMLMTVASARVGWLWAALVYLLGLVPLARMYGFRRWKHCAATGAVIAVAAGVVSYQVAPPGHARLRAEARRVGTVDGWQLTSAGAGGDAWCLIDCPHVGFFYVTAQTPEEAVSSYTALLEADGWTGGPITIYDDQPPSSSRALANEGWYKRGRIAEIEVLSPRDPLAKYRPPVAPGLILVRVSYCSSISPDSPAWASHHACEAARQQAAES